MRICYVASPSIHTDNWIRYFVNSGDEVHVITSSKTFHTTLKINIHYLNHIKEYYGIANYFMNAYSMSTQFKKMLYEIKPDILHAQYIGDTAVLAAISKFHPFIATAWGSDVLVTPKESLIAKLSLRYVLNQADIITCDGDSAIKEIKSISNHPTVYKIYHGVDTQLFKPSIKELNTVISTRRLEPVYDIETLISVAIALPDVNFLIAGDGLQRNYLESISPKNIKFLGSLCREEIAEQLSKSSIYVTRF